MQFKIILTRCARGERIFFSEWVKKHTFLDVFGCFSSLFRKKIFPRSSVFAILELHSPANIGDQTQLIFGFHLSVYYFEVAVSDVLAEGRILQLEAQRAVAPIAEVAPPIEAGIYPKEHRQLLLQRGKAEGISIGFKR
jgi:hypothetical protein